MAEPYPTYIENPLVQENSFLSLAPDAGPVPLFVSSKKSLPEPFWEGHPEALSCYWKTWELGFGWLKRPKPQSGFKAPYIDTAFNGHLFLWDSVFNLMWGRYGSRVFDFQRTLDNFYAKQHPDGFICREIDEEDGRDFFTRFDPSATGPNVFAWCEWEHFVQTGDRERLASIFPPVLAFHQWMGKWHGLPDGGLWTTGWGCGMDNQPRVDGDPRWDHGNQAWADACLQQALSAQVLLKMAGVLGRPEVAWLEKDARRLVGYANEKLWDPASSYYYDRKPDGSLNQVKSVGAYWALLAGAMSAGRIDAFLAHLEEPGEFKRPHRVPSLSADHPDYQADGGYWRGGVWPSTNYMILRGLSRYGKDSLAHEIGLNHLQNVAEVFQKTGTVWENYAPESAAPGNPSKPDFVGWAGIGPIAVLFEYVFGLRPQADQGRLVWDLRLVEAHGVKRYPFGKEGLLDLACAARKSPAEKPEVQVTSNQRLDLVLRWEGGEESRKVG
jgi:hypothetical protein